MTGKFYINAAAANRGEEGLRELIPDANIRRRMSRILKMGVGTAMECLRLANGARIDAIITATGLGCLADSEKFLASVIANGERMLNPTPFIQSTFNTIGGQIALLTGNRCYNMTYSHRATSFESALADALMLLSEGAAKNVLVGAADETTPTQSAIMRRMGAYRDGTRPGEGAHFFVIGAEPSDGCAGVIEEFAIDGTADSNLDGAVEIRVSKGYHTASAEALWEALGALGTGAVGAVVRNENYVTVLKCL